MKGKETLTHKQVNAIAIIERVLKIKYKGYTKNEANNFISMFLQEAKNEQYRVKQYNKRRKNSRRTSRMTSK